MERVADLIVRSLDAHGSDRVFSVPGESFLGLLDELVEQTSIDLVTCRHEGAAALAAVADAKMSDRPGVALVSRGPGLFNEALGLHVAQPEAVPPVVLMGQVPAADPAQFTRATKSAPGIRLWRDGQRHSRRSCRRVCAV